MISLCMMLCFILVGIFALANGDSSAVAFTRALVSHAQLTKGEIIKFDKIISNINTQFNSAGKFIVRIPGIYAFHFYSLSRNDQEIWLEFYKNKEYIVSIYAFTPEDWAAAGNTIILELKQDDMIYIKAVDNYINALYGTEGEIYTTFSGILLFPETGSKHPSAFSVALTHNVTLTGGATVKYDKILSNTGHGYNETTGEFTASVEGLYTIHYHALAEQGQEVWLDLYHNDQYINTAYGEVPQTWADAGNSAILELHPGDKLTVRSRPQDDVILFGGPEEMYCTFSAALVAPTGSPGTDHAFSVGLTRNADNTGSNHRVTFDKVFLNHGGNFNIMTGVFTASVHGIYVFHFHSLSDQDQEVYLDLYHNDMYVNSVYGHAAQGWAGGSNSAVLELTVEDTVYINMKNHTTAMSGSGDEIYTTFSGYLLSQL